VLECLSSCQGPGNPAKYPLVTMEEFTIEFLNRNYANRNQQVQWSADPA
jgi:hypothetical protein